jgi:hypothetical protein
VEQPVLADHPGRIAPRRPRPRPGKALARSVNWAPLCQAAAGRGMPFGELPGARVRDRPVRSAACGAPIEQFIPGTRTPEPRTCLCHAESRVYHLFLLTPCDIGISLRCVSELSKCGGPGMRSAHPDHAPCRGWLGSFEGLSRASSTRVAQRVREDASLAPNAAPLMRQLK